VHLQDDTCDWRLCDWRLKDQPCPQKWGNSNAS
jgi:hypothetical protein